MRPLALASAALAALLSAPAAADDALVARGAYLAAIMDCAGCHSGRLPTGEIDPATHLTGGTVGFEMPGLGSFWPPNLTPDATGLGGWSAAEIAAAVRAGLRPDGRQLAPVMPWPSYAVLNDADAAALAAYLMSLAPVANRVPGPLGPGEAAPLPFYRVTPPESGPSN
jgi:mono/diheme cytochrome c family protein